MTPLLQKRLLNLEKKFKWKNADILLDTWLQEHSPSGVANFWDILWQVPQELQLECLNRAMIQSPPAARDCINSF
jgi:hypothetical protein